MITKFKMKLLIKNSLKVKILEKSKKKLIFDIANARIEEMAEIIFLKNINFSNFKAKIKLPIFINFREKFNISCFKKNYISAFSKNSGSLVKLLDNTDEVKLCETALKIVQYGWKKEAIPFVQEKKSMIARIFHKIFS